MLQSTTLDILKSGRSVFLTSAPGMGYVALSRVQTLDGLYLEGINNRAFLVSDDAVRLDGMLREASQKAEREQEADS